MNENTIWELYNFVNDWKAGKFGIIPLKDAYEAEFCKGLEGEPYPTVWEYKKTKSLSFDDLNELGKEGWELCAYDSELSVCTFKRKKYDRIDVNKN